MFTILVIFRMRWYNHFIPRSGRGILPVRRPSCGQRPRRFICAGVRQERPVGGVMYGIDFHADDYAASVEKSRSILALMQAGRIDSFSVIPNMGCYEKCMHLLRESWDSFPQKPLLSVHINLIDGYRLSSAEPGSVIHNSWARIFFRGFFPGRKRNRLQAAFSAEIEAQLRAFTAETAELRDSRGNPPELRIDSHMHTHMIPLVFGALTDALDRSGLRSRVSFIRCSTEPLSMLLLTPGVAGTISPVNLAKSLILHLLSHSVRKKLRCGGINTGRIFGVAMSGEMDLKRVSLLLPKMKKYARKKDAYLEVLSHPGRVGRSEIAEEYGPDDIRKFLSPKRDTEYRMLMELPDSSRREP